MLAYSLGRYFTYPVDSGFLVRPAHPTKIFTVLRVGRQQPRCGGKEGRCLKRGIGASFSPLGQPKHTALTSELIKAFRVSS